jgi:hypothetical protein
VPTPITRPSLTTTLDQRYANQKAGGAFDVKKTLGAPGSTPVAGSTIDATSIQAQRFQAPNGFEVKAGQEGSQFIDVQSGGNSGTSTYIKGIDTTKYKG